LIWDFTFKAYSQFKIIVISKTNRFENVNLILKTMQLVGESII